MNNIKKIDPILDYGSTIINTIIKSFPKNNNIILSKIDSEFKKIASLKQINQLKKL